METEQGAPEAGVAVTAAVVAAAGAVQVTVVPLAGVNAPPVDVHVAEMEVVITTCSLTPTSVRVLEPPSGAAARVLVAMAHEGDGGAAGGGEAGGTGEVVGVATDTGPGPSSGSSAVYDSGACPFNNVRLPGPPAKESTTSPASRFGSIDDGAGKAGTRACAIASRCSGG